MTWLKQKGKSEKGGHMTPDEIHTEWKKSVASRTEVYRTRRDWLAARRSCIGASDVPGIYDLRNRGETAVWGTPFSVWADKVAPPPETAGKEPLRFGLGQYIEPFIANEFCTRTGHLLWNPGDMTIIRGEKFHHGCTPDRIIVDPLDLEAGPGVLELKHIDRSKAKDWKYEPPLPYLLQLYWQMHCTGLRWGVLCALVGQDDIVWHTVHYSPSRVGAMACKVDEFWQEYVVPEVPPPTDGDPVTGSAIQKVWPDNDDEKVIMLTSQFIDLDNEREELIDKIKELESRKRAIDHAIEAALQDATIGELPHCRFKFATVERKEYTVAATKYRRLTRSKKGS